jgi:hypothetical protein
MKFSVKAIFAVLLLSMFVFGCETGEQFVTREAGLWDVSSLYTRTFHDDVKVSEVTKTDSLGQFEFQMSGRGIRIDYAGVRDSFVWTLGKDDDRLTMYGPDEFVDSQILDQTDETMTLYWRNIFADSTSSYMIKTEKTAKLKRVL